MAVASRIPPWRKWTGISLFALHLVLPVIALIVVPIFGFPEGVNAILIGLSVVGGPDVILIASIAMLGKDGVADLMGRFGSVIKRLTKWDAEKTLYLIETNGGSSSATAFLRDRIPVILARSPWCAPPNRRSDPIADPQ